MDEPIILDPIALPTSPVDLPPNSLTAEQIYHEYGPRIYNIARKMIHNENDAEDVTQDVLLQIVRKLPTFRGESAFPTWLHRVTVNAALAHRRKQALRDDTFIAVTQSDLLDAGNQVASEREGFGPPEEMLISEEEQLLINQAIAELPEIYREVMILSDVESRPNAEIAEQLEITIAAVKSRLHRARLLLRDRLAPHFDHPSQDEC